MSTFERPKNAKPSGNSRRKSRRSQSSRQSASRSEYAQSWVSCLSIFSGSRRPRSGSEGGGYGLASGLNEFGYYFDRHDRLRSTKDRSPFCFDVYPSEAENQAHYEALGRIINQHVYAELEVHGLRRVSIPVDAAPGSPQGFFFASHKAENAKTLLILVHGAGDLRAGQWSRRLIINRSMDAGSQIPLIRRATAANWGVVCLNPNQSEDDSGRPIPGSESPTHHGISVWRSWVSKSRARQIGIVAHSAGGGVTGDMANRNKDDFRQRVKGVALVDAFCPPNASLARVGRHWVCSPLSLDTPMDDDFGDALVELSAGTTRHEEAVLSAEDSIWRFLCERLPLKASQTVEVVKESWTLPRGESRMLPQSLAQSPISPPNTIQPWKSTALASNDHKKS